MDRCALFVDANYALADGALAVHGTRNRDSVSWDYAGLLKLLGSLAADRNIGGSTESPRSRSSVRDRCTESRRSSVQWSRTDRGIGRPVDSARADAGRSGRLTVMRPGTPIPPELLSRPFRRRDAARFGLSRRVLQGRRFVRLFDDVYAVTESPMISAVP